MKELNDINSIRFPLINIRRTSNLAVAPINTFGLAIGLFMLAAPLMEWCEFKSPTLGVIFACGGICQYIIGIYDWYQNKTILCFIDFIFSFLHFLLYYFVYFVTDVKKNFVSSDFQDYMIGTFFVLFLVALAALAFACKNRGIIHLAYLGLLILADIFIIVWEYRFKRDANKEDKILKPLRKTAGYFLFLASIALWYTGVGRFINDIFQKEMIPLISPDL